jgi:cytochrome P450/NADPH-cytochrome P450 reductase
MSEHGGEGLIERGEGQPVTLTDTFESWEAKLWTRLSEVYNIERDFGEEELQIKIGKPRAAMFLAGPARGEVLVNKLLTAPGAPAKRHIEFQLPPGTTYYAGDHLAIVPTNPAESVRRVLNRLDMAADDTITITARSPALLPVDTPVSIEDVLSGYVELGQVARRKDVENLRKWAPQNGPTQEALHQLLEMYDPQVFAKRLTILDILEMYPDINIPIEQLIRMLPTMAIRQYSISSSPLDRPGIASITISVVDHPAYSGRGRFVGVATNYLSHLQPGDNVYVAVRPAPAVFHLPSDVTVPIVLFCAGSGFGPMRGFLQERALQKKAGREVGKALLFFGCRADDQDYIYADELAEWTKLGLLDCRPAFSQKMEKSLHCRHVQERIWFDRAEVTNAFKAGAQFYVCCSEAAAGEIQKTCVQIIKEVRQIERAQAEELLEKKFKIRYAREVFG